MAWLRIAFQTVALSIVLLSASVYAQEVDKTKPYEMIEIVADNLFSRLKANKDNIQENPDLLKTMVQEELMPYVDYRYASLKLLGPNLKGAKKADVGEFIKAFHLYLVSSYAQVLTLYSDQHVEFEPEKAINAKKRIIGIKVDVIDAPKPVINIEFKLRKNKKTNEWLAFDMIAEGISLLSSKQSEWTSKIRKEGILAVAQELESLAQNPVRFEGSK